MRILPLLLCISACLASTDGTVQPLGVEKKHNVRRDNDVIMYYLTLLVQHHTSVIEALQAKVTSLENTLQSRIGAVENKLPASFQPVAFTAQFSYDNGHHGVALGPHASLLFDNVLTNLGNGYSPNTGVFTAPVAGLYVFSLTAMSADLHGPVLLAIDKEGKKVLGEVWAEGSNDPTDQGSTQVSSHLSAGEKVWVRQDYGDAVRGSFWTVFTGFLVQADGHNPAAA